MKRLFGNTVGLKPNQIRRLENFYHRRIQPQFLISQELARDLSRLSYEISRQIGMLIDRQGKVAYVIVGDQKKIVIPSVDDYRAAPGRLKGLRCIHTHLTPEPLTADDLNDLALLRLDMMAAIINGESGSTEQIHAAHIVPTDIDGKPYRILPPLAPSKLDINCFALIQALETELASISGGHKAELGKERAVLVSVSSTNRSSALESLAELNALAKSCGIEVIDSVIQQRKNQKSKFLIGPGKLQDLAIGALQHAATLIPDALDYRSDRAESHRPRTDNFGYLCAASPNP
jgi:GTP-binding protein HflX